METTKRSISLGMGCEEAEQLQPQTEVALTIPALEVETEELETGEHVAVPLKLTRLC